VQVIRHKGTRPALTWSRSANSKNRYFGSREDRRTPYHRIGQILSEIVIGRETREPLVHRKADFSLVAGEICRWRQTSDRR
jgi:hypothetical protein